MIVGFYRVDFKLHGFIGLFKQANELSLNAEKICEFFNIKSEIESDTQTGKLTPSNNVFGVELRNVGFA